MAEPTPEVRAARRRLRELRLSLDARWKRFAEQRICAELLRRVADLDADREVLRFAKQAITTVYPASLRMAGLSGAIVW